MLFALVGLGGGYWVYLNKEIVLEKLRLGISGISPQLANLLGRSSGRGSASNRVGGSSSESSSSVFGGGGTKPADTSALREARMKRFAVLDDNGNAVASLRTDTFGDKDNLANENPSLPPLDLDGKED